MTKAGLLHRFAWSGPFICQLRPHPALRNHLARVGRLAGTSVPILDAVVLQIVVFTYREVDLGSCLDLWVLDRLLIRTGPVYVIQTCVLQSAIGT